MDTTTTTTTNPENSLCFAMGCVIVNSGYGSKVLQLAKRHGLTGGTVILGIGTVKNRLLDFLALNDIRKELVIMLGEAGVIVHALTQLTKELQLEKPNHGIAFCADTSGIFGTRETNGTHIKDHRGGNSGMYNAICTVVDKGMAEDVIDAATKAGSRGGTIIGARGSGVHETSKLFSMNIEPEKEIVLILSDTASTEKIVSTIRKDLEIDKPGHGIIFVQPLSHTFGLY